MGSFRLYRRVHIFSGLTVNVLRSGPSLSVEVRGAHVTLGRRGVTRTVGIPGTGIYYTSRSGYHTGVHSAHRDSCPAEFDGISMLARPGGSLWRSWSGRWLRLW